MNGMKVTEEPMPWFDGEAVPQARQGWLAAIITGNGAKSKFLCPLRDFLRKEIAPLHSDANAARARMRDHHFGWMFGEHRCGLIRLR